MPTAAGRARRWRRRGARSPRRSAGVMTSSSPAARARRSQIVAARAKAGRRLMAPTEHDAVVAAMGGGCEVLAVDAQWADRPGGAATKCLPRGPALVAIQQVNNETGVIQPIEPHRGDGARRGIAAAGRLRAGRGQDCRFPTPTSSPFRPQVRRAAGDRRAAGQGPRDAGGQRRAGEGLSPRNQNLPAAAGMAAALEEPGIRRGDAEARGACAGGWSRR